MIFVCLFLFSRQSCTVALHEKTARPHTDECRARIGEQMEHDPEGHERLQPLRRRRDVEPAVEEARAPGVRKMRVFPHLWINKNLQCLRDAQSGRLKSCATPFDFYKNLCCKQHLRLLSTQLLPQVQNSANQSLKSQRPCGRSKPVHLNVSQRVGWSRPMQPNRNFGEPTTRSQREGSACAIEQLAATHARVATLCY